MVSAAVGRIGIGQAYAGAAREPCPRGQVDWRPSGTARGATMGVAATGKLGVCKNPSKNAAREVNEIGLVRRQILSRRKGLILRTVCGIV
jgi:hypothetical protein